MHMAANSDILLAPPSPKLSLVRRGEVVSLVNVPPQRTLLELIREDLGSTGTKEGCGEGDCGACTVVLGEMVDGQLVYRAVNSCIRLAHSASGMALWTIEDIAGPDGKLHAAQTAMVQAHGSQCGFCTPGFVMSLFAMYQNQVCKGRAITRELAQTELAGNLCRCTGYQPILAAAQSMAMLPQAAMDETRLLQKLEQLRQESIGPQPDSAYKSPLTLALALADRTAHPSAQIIAGSTDVGLWVTKHFMQFDRVLDLSKVAELRQIERQPTHLAIGAAVSLTDAFAALSTEWPEIGSFAKRFAGLSVRNSGTLGGNIAGASPIGDSMPLLIALKASVVLCSLRGSREMALEDFYLGYKKTQLAGDELVAWIRVPIAGSPLPHPKAQPTTLRAGAHADEMNVFDGVFHASCPLSCSLSRVRERAGVRAIPT
jgi:xanthine dehydrogenase small subunit